MAFQLLESVEPSVYDQLTSQPFTVLLPLLVNRTAPWNPPPQEFTITCSQFTPLPPDELEELELDELEELELDELDELELEELELDEELELEELELEELALELEDELELLEPQLVGPPLPHWLLQVLIPIQL